MNDQPDPTTTAEPATLVRSFLDHLADADLDAAVSMLADDVAYTNVSLPTIRGRDRVRGALRGLVDRVGFKVHFHHVAVDIDDDGVVLTERTDALVIGSVHWQFWVYGRFEVRDGAITVWRDSFDWADVLVGLVRGVVALAVPEVGRRWPD